MTKLDTDTASALSQSTPPKKPRRFWWLHWMLGGILVCGLAYLGYGWLMRPRVNEQPTQKFVIRGQFPFSKGFDLSLQASFYSRNPTCQQTARTFFIFSAAEVNQEIRLPLSIHRDGEDGYVAEVEIDHFSPGFCDWKYGGMAYRISGMQQSDRGLTALGPMPNKENVASLRCRYTTIPKSDRQMIWCKKIPPPSFDKNHISSAEINFVWEGN